MTTGRRPILLALRASDRTTEQYSEDMELVRARAGTCLVWLLKAQALWYACCVAWYLLQWSCRLLVLAGNYTINAIIWVLSAPVMIIFGPTLAMITHVVHMAWLVVSTAATMLNLGLDVFHEAPYLGKALSLLGLAGCILSVYDHFLGRKSRYIGHARGFQTEDTFSCPVCFSDYAPDEETILCDGGHRVCESCISSYITVTLAHRECPIYPEPAIACLQSNCGHAYHLPMLYKKLASPNALQTLQHIHENYVRLKILKELPVSVSETFKEEQEKQLLKSFLDNIGGEGKMCRKCKYGPVYNDGCDNTKQHHREVAKVGGARYDNACPSCGDFAPNWSDWLTWDGVIRIVDQRRSSRFGWLGRFRFRNRNETSV